MPDEAIKFTETEARFIARLSEHEEYYRFFIEWLGLATVLGVPKPGSSPADLAEAMLQLLMDKVVNPLMGVPDLDQVIRGFNNIVLKGMHDELVLFILGGHPLGKPSKEHVKYFKMLDERIVKAIS